MSAQIYSLDTENKTIKQMHKAPVAELGFYEVRDVETWLASSGHYLFGRPILWVARQDVGADDQRSDLVGIADNGDLVIVELKRGKAQPDALMQVLRYAADYKSKTVDELAEIYFGCSKKEGARGLIVRADSLDDANQKIDKHVVGSGVNQGQICIVVAETFDDKILSICDYLEESNGEATFSIELWQYGVYKRQESLAEHFFVLEQIAPPLTTRERIEAEREIAKSKKWARDPGRIHFMSSLVENLNGTKFPLLRSRGETYAGTISIADSSVVFQFRRSDQHPWLRIPNELTWPEEHLHELNDKHLKMDSGGDHWWIEFTDITAADLKFEASFVNQLLSVLGKLTNKSQLPG